MSFATFNAILFAFCQNESFFKSLVLEIMFWILGRHVLFTKWKDSENFMA